MDTQPYKDQLTKELESLTQELQKLGINNPEVPEDWIATPSDIDTDDADENIVADRVEDWDERQATLAVLETRYNNVRQALQKIEEGTYGICEISGEVIEADRLSANPAARTCKEHMNDEADLET